MYFEVKRDLYCAKIDSNWDDFLTAVDSYVFIYQRQFESARNDNKFTKTCRCIALRTLVCQYRSRFRFNAKSFTVKQKEKCTQQIRCFILIGNSM